MIGTHKTEVLTENGVTSVKYHDTKVVTFSEDAIMLDTGVVYTNNQSKNESNIKRFCLGFQVYQKNYEWFADYNGKTYEFIGNNLGLSRN